MKLHHGFYSYFNLVKDQVIDYISTLEDITHIFSSGHSLGGAVSTLSSFIYSQIYPSKKIYNYPTASPRVGDINFANAYNSSNIHTVLLINLFDKIPDEPSIPSFQHVNTLGRRGFAVFFGNKKSYVDNHAPSLYFDNVRNAELILVKQ